MPGQKVNHRGPPRKWDPQRVIEAIRSRHAQGLTLKANRIGPPLYCAAFRYFGGWRQAVDAAGITVTLRKLWTADRVLARIHEHRRAGFSLERMRNRDRQLLYGACKCFGSWWHAAAAAGMPEGTRRKWGRAEIIAEIQALKRRGAPLVAKDLPDGLYGAICRDFGGWYPALEAAGIPVAKAHHWTPQGVLDELRDRHKRGVRLIRKANLDLVHAAVRHFGTWNGALKAARLPITRSVVPWSRSKVLEVLKVLKDEHHFDESTWSEDRKLVSAARRHFGSWRKALVTAGVLAPHERKRSLKKWPTQRIIAAIQDRHVRGLPLLAGADPRLGSAARRSFGSWYAAVTAAGIDAGKKPRLRWRWTRKRVVEEIRRRYEEGLTLRNVAKIWPGLAAAARERFGSWHAAIHAAGIQEYQ